MDYFDLLQEAMGVQYLDEAKFSFLPTFRSDPKTKAIVEVIDKGEELLKSNGIEDDAACLKHKGALDDANARTCDILQLVSDGFMIVHGLSAGPLVAAIVGVAWHLYMRLQRYYLDKNNEKAALEIAKNQLKYMDKIIAGTKGKEKATAEKHKAELEKQIEELSK